MQGLDRLLMLSFQGATVPEAVRETLESHDVSGVTLFRPNNYVSPSQLRELNEDLQASRSGTEPLLIAIDQEGGQLHAFGAPATMWPGNMALGAADDTELTRRVGEAMARELLAVGINVAYAPVADLASNPENPATGGRAFGDETIHVARHVAAMIEGIQSTGVAATVKHFPGKGAAGVDSHLAMPVIDHDLDQLRNVELVPFRAAIEAGVKLAMTGHFSLPALTGARDLPCTVSYSANTELLRDELGFDGPLITDALDMKALAQGAAQIVEVIAAVHSGVDLLLMTADVEQEERITSGLALGASRGLISHDRLTEASDRVLDLRRWVGTFKPPPLTVVGSPEHQQLSLEVARRSITLLKDSAELIPLDHSSQDRILVIEAPQRLLTPADTSDREMPGIASALRDLTDAAVESALIPLDGAIPDELATYETVILVTDAASLDPQQAAYARSIVASHPRVVGVARRTPWDIEEYPDIGTYMCCWSINRSSAVAEAEALMGVAPISGRLPVTVEGFPIGSGIDRP